MKTITILVGVLCSLCVLAVCQAPSLSAAAARSRFAGSYVGTYAHAGKVVAGPHKGAQGVSGSGNVTLSIAANGNIVGVFRGTSGGVRGNVAKVYGKIDSAGNTTLGAHQVGTGISGGTTGVLRLNATTHVLSGTLSGKSVSAAGDVGVVTNSMKLSRQ